MGHVARPALAGFLILALLLLGVPAIALGTPARSAAQQDPAAHPRLWVTAGDLPRLRGWATDANPMWRDGLAVLAEERKGLMDAGIVPAQDTGRTGWEPYPTEDYAELFAFMSLVHPDAAARDDYAQRARTLLMYVMTEAAKGPAAGEPFRDPEWVAPHSDRARWTGESYALTVDWIYPILTAEDKATIRDVFLRWCEEIVTDGYNSPYANPALAGLVNDPALLADRTAVRWAGNNYFTSHLRNVGLMALALDPADDPGGELGAYLDVAVGAYLYMADDLLRTDAAGGLAPEGFEYSPQAVAYVAELLLALHTAGQADPERWGRQVTIEGNPFWDQVIPAYLHSLSPRSAPAPEGQWFETAYLPAWYGDGENYWAPDFIGIFGILGRYDDLTGNAERLEAIRWIQTHLPPGGEAEMIGDRVATASSHREAILYFLLYDPTAPEPADPRPSQPLVHFAPGIGRFFARTGWDEDATWFSYGLGWIAIDHQNADGNGFAFYRDGEWLTKGLVGYGFADADGVPPPDYAFPVSENHNTIAVENDPPGNSGPDAYYDLSWLTGSQFEYSPAGNPAILAMSVAPGYAYALGDATNLYNSTYEGPTDVRHASRSIVWLAPDAIVVYDRAATATNGRFKRFWLNFPAAATVEENRTTMATAGGQQLVVTTLLPADATPEVEPLPVPVEFMAVGEPMRYRLRVEAPGNPREARFLHVLQGADAGAAAPAVVPLESADGAFAGTVVGSTAVLFPVELGGEVGEVRYTVPAGTTAHLITGLTPGGDYAVTSTPNAAAIEVVVSPGAGFRADDGGVLLVGELPEVLDASLAFATPAAVGPVADPAAAGGEPAVDAEVAGAENQDEAVAEAAAAGPARAVAEAVEGGAAAQGTGEIVFEATDEAAGTRHMYRVAATAGAEPEDLSLALDALGPSAPDEWVGISPDGEWLLFGTERFDPGCAGWPCLAVVPADLSSAEVVRVGGEPVHPANFGAVAAGGDRIVFPADGGPHALDLWAIAREGDGWGAPVLLTAESGFAFHDTPAIAADGSRVLFNCGDQPYADEGTAICEVGADGSGFRVVLTPADAPPGTAPGGAQHHADYANDGAIVFQSRWSGAIWRLPPDGVPAPVTTAFEGDGAPCVLADGRIASLWLGRAGNEGTYELKVMTPDGAAYAMLVTGMPVEDIGCGG